MLSAYSKLKVPVPPKEIHKDNIEILFEQRLLKIRDSQDFSHQESPSVELRFLAMNNGIRTITTTNTKRNMFCISESDINQLATLLNKTYPVFQDYLIEKVERDKVQNQESKLPQW